MAKNTAFINLPESVKEMQTLAKKYEFKITLKQFILDDTSGNSRPLWAVELEEQIDKMLLIIQTLQYIKQKLLVTVKDKKLVFKSYEESLEKLAGVALEVEEHVKILRFEKDLSKAFLIMSQYRVKSEGTTFKNSLERNMYLSIKDAVASNLVLTEEMEQYVLSMRNMFLLYYDEAQKMKAALTAHVLPSYLDFREKPFKWSKRKK